MLALHSGENRGGSITTANASQVVAAENDYRRGLTFQNTSDTDMWLAEYGGAAAVGTGYKIPAGQAANISTSNTIHVFCTVAGKTFAATEF